MHVFVNAPTCPSLQAAPAADTGAGSLAHTALETAPQHPPRQSRTVPDFRMQLQSLSDAVLRHVTTAGSAAMHVFVFSPTALSSHDPGELLVVTAVNVPDASSSAHTDAATACQHAPRQSRTAPDARMQLQSPLVPALRQATTDASAWMHILVFSPTVRSSQPPVVLDDVIIDAGSLAQIEASIAPQHSPKQSRTPPDARTQWQSVLVPPFKQDTTNASAWMQVLVLSPTVVGSQGAPAITAAPWRGGAAGLVLLRWRSASCDSVSSCRTCRNSASDAASFSSSLMRCSSSQPPGAEPSPVGRTAAEGVVAAAASAVHRDSSTVPQHAPRQPLIAPDARRQLQSVLVPLLRQATAVGSA